MAYKVVSTQGFPADVKSENNMGHEGIVHWQGTWAGSVGLWEADGEPQMTFGVALSPGEGRGFVTKYNST